MTDCTATAAPPKWAKLAVCEACGEELAGPTVGRMHERCVRRLLGHPSSSRPAKTKTLV